MLDSRSTPAPSVQVPPVRLPQSPDQTPRVSASDYQDPPSLNEAVVWLGRQLQAERRELEQRHAALVQGFQEMILRRTASASTEEAEACGEDSCLPKRQGVEVELKREDKDHLQRDPYSESAFELHRKNTTEHVDIALADRGLKEKSVGQMSLSDSVSSWKKMRYATKKVVVETHWCDYIMGVVILANCVTLGVEIQFSASGKHSEALQAIEHAFIAIFLVELVIRLIGGGRQCFKDPWFLIDAMLVSLGVLTNWILSALDPGLLGKLLIVRMLRLVRLVRSLRFLRLVRPLWRLVGGAIGSISTVLSATVLLFGAIYFLACVGMELVAGDAELHINPNTEAIVKQHFRSLPALMLTLIQFATCDSIGSIYHPLITERPLLVLYFLVVMLVLPVTLMNLVTAIIVDHSIQASVQDAELQRCRMRFKLEKLIPALRKIFDELDISQDGLLDLSELDLTEVTIPREVMVACDSRNLHHLFHALDTDGSGLVDKEEFVDGMCCLLLNKVPIENLHMLHLLRQQGDDMRVVKSALAPSCSYMKAGTSPSNAKSRVLTP